MRSNRAKPNPLAVLGLDAESESTYRLVIRHAGSPPGTVANALGISADELPAKLAKLSAEGLVQLRQDAVHVPPPDIALGRLVGDQLKRWHTLGAQLESLRELMPLLRREHVDAAPAPGGDRIQGSVVVGGDFVKMWTALANESDGPILQFRPDQWRLPTGRAMDDVAIDLLASGREFRSLYPAIALNEAAGVLRARAEGGEQIRVVADLPSRVVVFGRTSAMVPQEWAVNNERRVVVRQPALVAALRYLFEQMWARGLVVPGLPGGELGTGAERTLLLERMSRGDKDEQIARALGVSLRTVRRRIADLQSELGVSSRFQTGVEAVRRGWV